MLYAFTQIEPVGGLVGVVVPVKTATAVFVPLRLVVSARPPFNPWKM